jgi:hypothetical protein
MADVKYEVVVEYQLAGKLQQQLPGAQAQVGSFAGMLEQGRRGAGAFGGAVGDAGGRVSALGRALASFAGDATSAFTGAVERAGELAKALAMVAGGAAIGAAAYGVTTLNSEIEKTKIGLADILESNGVASNLTEGLGMASDLMREIRKDAAALPGETRDLAKIFKLAEIGGLQAGASSARTEKLSALAMAFGMGTAELDSGTVARELAMLIQGRAGSHNILGLQLAGLGGDKAKAFNEMSSSARFAFLEKEFGKHKDSIAAFSDSYEGLSSTLKDNAKLALQMATSPLFERVKQTLRDVNGWFDQNKTSVEIWAQALGDRLADAFDWGRRKIEEWWPAVSAFAEHAWTRLTEIWDKAQPYVERFGAAVKDALADPTTIDRIESVLKLYAGVKIGSAFAGPAASLAGGAMQAFGGGEGLAGLAAAGPAAGAAAAALAMLAAGAYGAQQAIEDGGFVFHQAAFDAWANTKESLDEAGVLFKGAAEDFGTNLMTALKPALELSGTLVLEAARGISGALDFVAHHLQEVGAVVGGAAAGPLGALAGMGLFRPHLHQTNEQFSPKETPYEFGAGGFVKNLADGIVAAQRNTDKRTQAAAHTTTIQRVEINVSSNHEPSRVARDVMAELVEVKRHPTVSRAVKNYSSIAGR